MSTVHAFLYLSCTGSLVVLRLPLFLGEQKREPFGHYLTPPPPIENPCGLKMYHFFRGKVTTEFKNDPKLFIT